MKLSRRQFSKSLLAGTLISGLSGLSDLSDLFAQSAKPTQKPIDDAILVGVEHGPIVSNSGSHLNPHSHAIEDYKRLPSSDTPASALQGLTVQHLNTCTLISKRTVIDEPLLCPSDRISGVTYLGDGTLLVVINPDAGSAKGAEPSRLLLLNHKKSSNRWEISGPVYVSNLFKDQSLDSLCLLRSGILIGMVTKKDGTGPAHVVEVNPGTGAVSFSNLVSLPADRRFSALAEASDGKLFTSVFRNNGTTELWALDMTDRTATFLIGLTTLSGCSSKTCTNVPEITPWYHGLQSLIVTPSGQLLAHGNLEYFLPDTLYAINLSTGFMTEIDSYPVARVSLSKQAG
jgi:hypothetical protein